MIIDNILKTEDDQILMQQIARRFGLFPETVEILFNRGVRNEKEVEYFLNPGKHHFKDPFSFKGIKEASERIKEAKKSGETVVVYGDYDADGICATSILYSALKEYGVNAIPFVPERSNGYGLSVETIDKLFDETYPDLLITVDCGISCHDEIEYVKSLGVDVIVTDHHELPDRLPECVIVNCKMPGEYGFEGLCGAGVAFKLATALLGTDANKYLDYAAIATIADSMPLVDENRDIVFEGIKQIKSGRAHRAVNELIAISNVRDVNSTTLAFTIAPRINAAGRMGDAYSALRLLLSDNEAEIEELALKLNAFNTRRQQECEALYKSARAKLIAECYDKKVVVLCDSDWNSGLVGIIAARLVEEFTRPVVLFVNNEGSMHGSARSVESVNIFEAISSCKELVSDFGGHAQAAGVTVSEQNFPKFKAALIKYIDEKYSYDIFKPQKSAEMIIENRFSLKLAKEINRLEPFGTGNKKPQFCLKALDLSPAPMRVGSPHLMLKTPQIDLIYFNGLSSLELLSSGVEKYIVFEPNVSIYNNEESLKGYVKDVEYVVTASERVVLDSYRESLLTAFTDNDDFLYVSGSMTENLAYEAENEHFGTLFAVYNPLTLNNYPRLTGLERHLFSTANRNLVNNVVISPTELNVAGYRKIIYLDRPLGCVKNFGEIKETFINRSERAFDYSTLDVSKQTFGEIFKALKKLEFSRCNSSVDLSLKCNLDYDKKQLIFAIEVFFELGLFSIVKGVLRYNDGLKTSLDSSRIYEEVEKLK